MMMFMHGCSSSSQCVPNASNNSEKYACEEQHMRMPRFINKNLVVTADLDPDNKGVLSVAHRSTEMDVCAKMCGH